MTVALICFLKPFNPLYFGHPKGTLASHVSTDEDSQSHAQNSMSDPPHPRLLFYCCLLYRHTKCHMSALISIFGFKHSHSHPSLQICAPFAPVPLAPVNFDSLYWPPLCVLLCVSMSLYSSLTKETVTFNWIFHFSFSHCPQSQSWVSFCVSHCCWIT